MNNKQIEPPQKKYAELKAKFLEYYRGLPVQKLAADFIGRSADTIQNWMKEDEEFAAQIGLAKAEWAQKTTKQVRSKEWLLERVMKDHFAQRNELTGADGKDLPTPILGGTANVHTDNSTEQAS